MKSLCNDSLLPELKASSAALDPRQGGSVNPLPFAVGGRRMSSVRYSHQNPEVATLEAGILMFQDQPYIRLRQR